MFCQSGLRTAEHVRYGYALAMRDVEQKIKLAYGSENKQSADGLAAKVLSIVDKEHGETFGVSANRLRGTKAQVEALLVQMTEKGMVKAVECEKGHTKTKYFRYYAI